jgi:hypothetical protein
MLLLLPAQVATSAGDIQGGSDKSGIFKIVF